MAGNNTNNIRCEYCNGVSGLIIMENVFKLKNLGNEMEYCLHSQNGRYSIGRELGVHIAVSKNTGVSRRHASVWVGNDSKLYISDAYSSNGTYVNGIKLIPGKPRRIKVHDIISIGFSCILARCDTHSTLRHGVFKVMRNMQPVRYHCEMYALYPLSVANQ